MPFSYLGTRDAEPEPKLPQPEPFLTAGPGVARLFIPGWSRSGGRYRYSPDPVSAQELCKSFPVSRSCSQSRTGFPGTGVGADGQDILLGARYGAHGAFAIFSASSSLSVSIILVTHRSLDYSAHFQPLYAPPPHTHTHTSRLFLPL